MSLDRSLKSSGSLDRHRNVLTRAERVARLKAAGRDVTSATNLPKVANRKVNAGKKSTKKGADAAADAAPAKK